MIAAVANATALASSIASGFVIALAAGNELVPPLLAISTFGLWLAAVVWNRIAGHANELDRMNVLAERNPRR